MILKLRAAALLLTLMPALACVSSGAAASGAGLVQSGQAGSDDDWCDVQDEDRYCEVREFNLAADRGTIAVDATPNGGIRIEGWDRDEVLVRAKVQTRGRDAPDAAALAREVEISTSGKIRARGPRTDRKQGWSVSYRVYAPHASNVDVESVNGGIGISDLNGDIRFRTTNGGIRLSGLAGDVRGSTTNGALRIELSGDEWQGRGLDVATTNGSVKISVPEGYSAHLETGTVNGSMRFDFPIRFEGRIRHRLEVDLGDGGRTIRAVTTNGSVTLQRG